ncbi:hypothetical protein JIX56_35155 [Streptomyces sp. CA-210063]|uniref:hypothetical protein n=1 Tax=Streptomyces sp. CA-210063 TaxID=2801029 RepID=UPI00214B67AD|nr:hypothetical protein [Streptomyces sp. CA-210063]UUU34674.1 hypothetical protein JIX56_35155 [Streptomyces sp. CA-210063]
MDAELAALAAAGATTLVQSMVGDGWAGLRDRVASFFSRGRSEQDVQDDLEESRAELVAAQDAGDEEAVADVQAEWRNRLRRTLRADPNAAAELRALLDELVPEKDEQGRGSVYNTINGSVHQGTVIQAGSIGRLSNGESRR